MLKIDKELFQWESERYVYVSNQASSITHIQFYNRENSFAPEVPVENGKAQIPDCLLKEALPIVALGCKQVSNSSQVMCRKTFKVLKRARPESYIDTSENFKEIVYDGGVEI